MRPLRLACIALLLAALPLGAQAPAGSSGNSRITGRVVDARTGEGIADAGIQVVGQSTGTTSGVGGRFVLSHLASGTVTLHVRRIGYQPKTITGLMLGAGLEQEIALERSVVQLTSTVVEARRERGSAAAAVDVQRNATGVVNAIAAEQIGRSPDANAAQALQRVSGVTIQDNKYVIARGLSERYTSTSLNGARLPSPETDRKVVPLDLFPAGLLQTIVASKTFTPDQSADFAGAAVDIQTREFPAQTTTSYTWGGGYNDATTGRQLISAPTLGLDWLGIAGGDRSLPSFVAQQARTFDHLSGAQLNQVVRAFRPVWSPEQRAAAPNGNVGISRGGSLPLPGNTSLGYVVSGSYSSVAEARRHERRALAVPGQDAGTQQPFNEFFGETGTQSARWGGIANLSALFGPRTLVTLNNMVSRTADNEARADTGLLQQGGIDEPARRTTIRFIERTVRSNQVKVEQSLRGAQTLTFAATNAAVIRREPDRADFVQVRPAILGGLGDGAWGPFEWLSANDDAAKRTFASVDESNWNFSGDYRVVHALGTGDLAFKAGGALRTTRRDVNNQSYSIFGRNLTHAQLQLPPEQIFDGRFSQDTGTKLIPGNNNSTGEYRADDRVTAGYAMTELPLGRSLKLTAGARVEQWHLHLAQALLYESDPVTPDRRETDVLPSLTLGWQPGEDNVVRLAATRTLARPEYREISTTTFCDVIGERCTRGNPDLQRGLIDNLDLRWEMYPGDGELLSVGLFAKKFHSPIERIEIATSGASTYSFVNADAATNFGVELDGRRGLGFLSERLSSVAAFGNVSLIQSRISLGNGDISALTSTRRPMAMQSPYVLNAGVTWSGRARTSATVLYNVIGRRITSVGSKPVLDTYEQARPSLDASLQLPVTRALQAKLALKNLLDSPYRETSGSVVRNTYVSGRLAQLSFTLDAP